VNYKRQITRYNTLTYHAVGCRHLRADAEPVTEDEVRAAITQRIRGQVRVNYKGRVAYLWVCNVCLRDGLKHLPIWPPQGT
jgi:hypothetical protein